MCEILGGPHELNGRPLFRVTRLPANYFSDKKADHAMDAIAEQAEADRIEAEAASLAHLGDDDDFGDRDGDEGF